MCPGDRGRVRLSAFVVDAAGNKYLRSHATVELRVGRKTSDDAYIEVTSSDKLVVGAGDPLVLVEAPEPWEEHLVWVDVLHWASASFWRSPFWRPAL